MRRDEAPLRSIRITLSEIPTPGMAREIASGIAAIAVALGISFVVRDRRHEAGSQKKERKAERERLLAELEELERAHRAGDVGPRTYEAARRELIDALARTLATESAPG